MVDSMLGEFRKWLLFLGVDTAWKIAPDEELYEVCLEDGRILITADRAFAEFCSHLREIVCIHVRRTTTMHSDPDTDPEADLTGSMGKEEAPDQRHIILDGILDILGELGYGIPFEGGWLSRCSTCGEEISLYQKQDYIDLLGDGGWPGDPVPDLSLGRTRHIYLCPNCPKTYWDGTHTESIRNTLAEAIGRRTVGTSPGGPDDDPDPERKS